MTTEPARTYPTPETPHVGVRGEATLEVEPELARIAVTVSARGTDRRATLDDLTRRNAQVLDLVKGCADAVEKLETGAFVITPELRERGRGERVRAYHGSVRVSAALTDFTVLGELITRLADLELTRVDGPWWSLRPDSPAYGEARRQAVRDAVQRAREYAEALGARLVALVELADEGVQQSAPFRARPAMRTAAFAAPGGAAESAHALDMEPERQSVYAQVTAHFTMTAPDLSA
ncbi:SIMPL domain-containing protein [Actinacidiphila glaucinigra]|uniref:SIMPL domain-containing protein n=1 Tax=Actinacidiphila glaucinigra TaxID=235986 RepID=UPI002DD99E68|nr:SIMPL domain-containing protein [Actinacidiphila glaucinigra]WSD62712.1 SIMPL domain-containing protein [Actinacidiphila glaucinigra]